VRKKQMSEFFDNYLNIKKIVESKREYKRHMARVEAMPEEYRYVFKKIQQHMWMFAGGAGYDMMKIHYDLIELFEEGIANGKHVLEITGEDVAGFSDELLKNARTYTEDWKMSLNRDIMKKFGKSGRGDK
jgi:DNA-binding ferritin-like protein (Dps family)